MRRQIHTLKTAIVAFFLLWQSPYCIAVPGQPVLIDYQVSGNEQAPIFVPESLNLYVGTPYLFIIENLFENNINFIYEKFGQVVYTHYLQGVPGVSQNSMNIPAESKVTWLLEANQPGEFLVYAMNMSSGQKGPASKLIIKPLHQAQNVGLPQQTYSEQNLLESGSLGLDDSQVEPILPSQQATIKSAKREKSVKPRFSHGRH